MNVFIVLSVLLMSLFILGKKKCCPENFGISIISSFNIKAVCSLIIILHHLSFQYKDSLFFSQFSKLGTITVAIFFFMSGYGLMKQAIKYENYYVDFLSKRFSKLLPPFLIATICYTYYSVLINGSHFVLNRFIEGFPPLPTSWFVYSIGWLYLTFYFAGRFSRNINRLNILLFICTILYCIIVLFVLHWGGWWVNAVFAFNIGVFVCSYEVKLLKYLESKTLLVFIVMLLFCLTLATIFLRVSPIYNLTICCLLWITCVNMQSKEIALLRFIGNISYEIYLVQGAIIALLVRYLHIEQMLPIIGTFLTITLTFIVAYILQSVSKFFIKII